jgi:hypothetical protein
MSGWGVTNIKTITKANKPFFTFMIIAFIAAVILFVPAAAFAESDADGDGFAEGGDAAETSFEPASNDTNNPEPESTDSPSETPTGDDSITEEGSDYSDDTETNTGLIDGNQDPALQPETAADGESVEGEAIDNGADTDLEVQNDSPESVPQPETAAEEESNENEETDTADTNEGSLPDAGGEGNSYKAELT